MGRLNKPEIPGYSYRSPRQTNANDLTPNLREDAVASQRADIRRIRTGLEAPAENAGNRRRQEEAGGRALSRTGIRGGLLSAAFQSGYEAGRAIEEKTGVGKKVVNKMGKAIDKMAVEDRVELSKESKRRIKEESDFEAMSAALRKADEDIEKEKKAKKMAVGGMSTKMSPKQEAKVGKVMKEFKAGSLHSGKGSKVVTKPKQAVAIAISEARRMKKK